MGSRRFHHLLCHGRLGSRLRRRRPAAMVVPEREEVLPGDREGPTGLPTGRSRPWFRRQGFVVLVTPPEFRGRADVLGRLVSMELLHIGQLVQLVRDRRARVSGALSGQYLVYGAGQSRQVPGIHGVSEEGWEVLAETKRRGAELGRATEGSWEGRY